MTGALLLLVQSLAVPFVENEGQWDFPALYMSRMGPMTVFVEERGWRFTLEERDEDGERSRGLGVRMAFEGSEAPAVSSEERLPGHHNYFLGDDPSRWRAEVPLWGRVRLAGLYPGIDVVLRSEDRRLEYDLLLESGADLRGVSIRVEGASGLRVDAEGGLVIETALGEVKQPPPRTWEVGPRGEERRVECRHVLVGDDRFAFEVEGRTPGWTLVVDPGLVYSTFLGGAAGDWVFAIALDGAGAATVAGLTWSAAFPTTVGAFDSSFGGATDAFVARISPSGSALVYATYLGGSGYEEARGVAVDATGSATVAGKTASPDFPTTFGALDPVANGLSDAFVTRLSPAGSALEYSTFLGGASNDAAHAVEVDATGVATVAGSTSSSGFPTTPGAFDTAFDNSLSYTFPDGFVARLSPAGSSLSYSTFLGGNRPDEIHAFAIATDGAAVVVGSTISLDFPTTPGAFDTTLNSAVPSSHTDGFVARLSASGASLLQSTFLGGESSDVAFAVALDASGAATVAGETGSLDHPATAGSFATSLSGGLQGIPDAFVARFSPSGTTLAFSTFLGGSGWDRAWALGLEPNGVASLAGFTASADFPATPGAFDTTFNGPPSWDAFVARLSPTGADLLHSTFLGGTGLDVAYALAPDGFGRAIVAGETGASDFPSTAGAFAPSPGGSYDAFVAKIDLFPAGVSAFGNSTPGCGGPLPMGVISWPFAGNSMFAITCENTPASAIGLLAFSGAGLSNPYTLGPLEIWIDPASAAFFSGLVAGGPTGTAAVPIPIPANPALVGLQAFAQFLWPDPCTGVGVSASNALALTVQP